eukprot:TRINITY_DN224_c0_g1_i1.p3 TRINITY_DN224_c0_g1~~TRINITY_DN224_c0_g1_i1.p3  ORF type:complete len:236 (-),score=64.00 TRINITY_DN224_c0_g1_i1:222-929(-)
MPAPDPVDVPPLARPRAGALPAAVGTTRAEATGAGAAAAREASLRHFNADWFVDNGRYRDAQSWTPPIKVRAGLGPPLPLLPGQTTRARRYRVEDVAVGTPVCPWLWSVTVPALFHPGLPAGSVEPENDDLARWEYAYADEWPGAKTSKTALVRRRILSLLDGDLSMLAQIMWDDFGVDARDNLAVRRLRFLLYVTGRGSNNPMPLGRQAVLSAYGKGGRARRNRLGTGATGRSP